MTEPKADKSDFAATIKQNHKKASEIYDALFNIAEKINAKNPKTSQLKAVADLAETLWVPESMVLDAYAQSQQTRNQQLQNIKTIVDKIYEMAFGNKYHPREEREQEIADGITRLHQILSAGSFAKESALKATTTEETQK